MSLFSRLFGSGSKQSEPETFEVHQEFRIFVAPIKESGGHRISARIEYDIEGDTKVHHMIRADVCNSLEEAQKTSLAKAKHLIDQQGAAIFR